MKSRVRYKTFDQISFTDMLVYSKLPDHPFWSNIEKKIDFSFADTLCSVLYSGLGQHPFAPSLKLKIHLVQAYYNLSDRLVEEKVIGDLFIKRFLGLPVDFFGFDHSTIGLDRSRMGSAMFHACHLYILAQMNHLGLWGDKNEQWIIDSFPAHVALSKVSAYRLIKQGMLRIFQHLKRSHRTLYKLTYESVAWDALLARLPKESSDSEKMLAFSKLVAQAHGLLQWCQLDDVATLEWTNKQAQQKFSELQEVLKKILVENSRSVISEEPEEPKEPKDPDEDSSSNTKDDNPEEGQTNLAYEKIPFKKRPTNRIISATDPDAQFSVKGATKIKGYKIQNLTTASGVTLNTRVVPAIEHDRDAMCDMVKEIKEFFRITPTAVLGDTAYGHGQQRVELSSLHIEVIAPVPMSKNPTGLYNNDQFTYDHANDVYTCPSNNKSTRTNYNTEHNGTIYYFGKACKDCSEKTNCTESKTGRSIFRSDFHDIYEKANIFNESEEGQITHKLRYSVERKNQELKNDCGLGQLKTRSKKAVSVKANLAAIVVNLKLTVRRTIAPKIGFLRRTQLT